MSGRTITRSAETRVVVTGRGAAGQTGTANVDASNAGSDGVGVFYQRVLSGDPQQNDLQFRHIAPADDGLTAVSQSGQDIDVAVDITGATDIGADLADADEIGVYDASATANRKSALSRVWAYVRTKIFGSLTNADRLLKSDGDGTASEGQIEDSVSGGVLDLVATITATRSLTLPDADLDLSQITGGLTGADATLMTGTAGSNGNAAAWNADGDLVDAGYALGDASAKGVTGADANAVTGTAGGTNKSARWNADGDLVEGSMTDDGSTVTVAADLELGSGNNITNAGGTPNFGDANNPFGTVSIKGVSPLHLYRDSSTYGAQVNWYMKNDADIYHNYGRSIAYVEDDTAGAEGGSLIFYVSDSGTLAAVAKIIPQGIELASGKVLSIDGNTVIDAHRLVNRRTYTVNTLPAAGTSGRDSFATDGRKAGEGAGAGTGVAVFDDGANWIAVDTGATVAA